MLELAGGVYIFHLGHSLHDFYHFEQLYMELLTPGLFLYLFSFLSTIQLHLVAFVLHNSHILPKNLFLDKL